jgi:hypothetical protein
MVLSWHCNGVDPLLIVLKCQFPAMGVWPPQLLYE